MTAYFVTRHKGAVEWAARNGIDAELVEHFEAETIEPGDRVLGTLPVPVAARVCARGGRYFHLSIEMPASARGRELSAEEMDAFGAKFEEFEVGRVANA